MDNKKIDVSSKIEKLLSGDGIEFTRSISYEFREDDPNYYINDSAYDITPSTPKGHNLTEEEIYEIAESYYNYQKTSEAVSSNITKKGKKGAFIDKVITVVKEVSPATASGLATAANGINKAIDWANTKFSEFGSYADAFGEYFTNLLSIEGADGLAGIFNGIMSVVHDGLADYKDGISETSFGALMEESWGSNSSKSFLNYFNRTYSNYNATERKVNIMESTPLDPGDSRESLFGTMILGTPYTFSEISDPNNRSFINSFIKDSKILSLTPGMPKFNGLTSYSTIKNSILNQTETPDEMLAYLTRNGLDANFSTKDKRYYTFEAKYEDYLAYLETMLNAIWIKLGLSKNGEQFNLFSFFDIKQEKEGGINYSGASSLKPQYNSSIGFFTNIASSVSESIDSQTTSNGSSLSDRANTNSAEYQNLNYDIPKIAH